MAEIIGVGQLSLLDLNDAIISGTPPANPTIGALWIDESVTPAMLKKWNGSIWVEMGELDPDLSETIEDINETLGNMANDNIINFQERQVIKDKLTEIIGYIIDDAETNLPSPFTLTNSEKGGFWAVRKSALNAGIPNTDATYINVATQYDNLRLYLGELTPVKPWDLRDANKDSVISVVKATFRDKWLQYYLAVDALSTATAEKLKKNVDDIDIKTRNLLKNSTFNDGDNGWVLNHYGTVLPPEPDKPNSNILQLEHINDTGNTNVNSPLYNNYRIYMEPEIGDKITFSFDFYCEDESVSPVNTVATFRRFANAEGGAVTSTPVSLNLSMLGIDGVYGRWVRGKYTYTFTSAQAVAGWYSFGVYMSNSSPTSRTARYKYREISIIEGVHNSGWTPAPEDLEGRITNVESKVTGDAIINTVTRSERWIEQINIINQIEGLIEFRYIRDWINGSTANTSNHWVEIMAMVGEDNVALNKPAITDTGFDASVVTDGITDSLQHIGAPNWIQVDLGEVRNDIDTINVWHYYADGRTYHNSKTEVSVDGENWVTVFDSALEGEYEEIADGRVTPVNINVKGSLRDVGNEIEVLRSTINNVEQQMTADGIFTTITESIGFQNILDGKADSNALADYYSIEAFNQFEEDLDDRIGGVVDTKVNFDAYVTKLELDETSKAITARFSATGGMNLIKNSIGFAGTNFWTDYINIVSIQNNELDILGFGSGFNVRHNSSYGSIYQTIPVVPDKVYTMSWYEKIISVDEGGYGIMRMYDGDSTSDSFLFSIQTPMITDGFIHRVETFTPTGDKIMIRLGGHLSNIIYTGLMLTIGDVPLQWTLATGEMYNTNIRMDINGIRVSQLDADRNEIGYTQITPEEFAGYYDSDGDGVFEKVFYLNGEETVTKKFRALEEITMGTIKIIKVEAGGNMGWAFVPITED